MDKFEEFTKFYKKHEDCFPGKNIGFVLKNFEERNGEHVCKGQTDEIFDRMMENLTHVKNGVLTRVEFLNIYRVVFSRESELIKKAAVDQAVPGAKNTSREEDKASIREFLEKLGNTESTLDRLAIINGIRHLLERL